MQNYIKRIQKESELLKYRANQDGEGAAAAERTWRQVLTTKCHLSRSAMSITRRATFAELSTCTIKPL
jgi:hypothetical protein